MQQLRGKDDLSLFLSLVPLASPSTPPARHLGYTPSSLLLFLQWYPLYLFTIRNKPHQGLVRIPCDTQILTFMFCYLNFFLTPSYHKLLSNNMYA